MPKFEVDFEGTVLVTISIEVDADSEEEAKAKAAEKVEEIRSHNWHIYTEDVEDIEVVGVNKVSESGEVKL